MVTLKGRTRCQDGSVVKCFHIDLMASGSNTPSAKLLLDVGITRCLKSNEMTLTLMDREKISQDLLIIREFAFKCWVESTKRTMALLNMHKVPVSSHLL